MLNEAIFRSPKILRNFIDFEVNTGKDIKGEPSQTLKANVNLRKEQLDKLPKNHKDREILQNEYDAAKRALDALRSKYNFENLTSFINFRFKV